MFLADALHVFDESQLRRSSQSHDRKNTLGVMSEVVPPAVRLGTTTGRAVVAAAVLGSGLAFLDGTVVNVALRTDR